MFPTDIFPTEIWVRILASLEVADLRNYQNVCKGFRQWTETTPALQFRLELDAVGYVESKSFRNDVSDEERLSILREHIHRRKTLLPSRVDTLWQVPSGVDPRHAAVMMQVEGQLPVFSDGVLARRMTGNATKNHLEIVQLPSPNRGTELCRWALDENGISFRDEFWVQPSFDLLVLPKIDPRIDTIDAWYNPKGDYEFHLRTLSGNNTHPDAYEPVLRLPNQPLHTHDLLVVKFMGRLMLFQLPVGVDTKLVIWDWMTGVILLDEILEDSGIGFAVVSDDLIAITRKNTTLEHDDSSTPSIGSFNVFRLDFSSDSELNLVLVGRFELPGTNDTLISSPRTRSVFRTRWIGLSFAPEPTWSATADVPIVSPPKVFETSNNERILQLNVTLFLREDNSLGYEPNSGNPKLGSANFEINGKGPLPLCASICIPISTILRNILEAPTGAESNKTIPWSDWGPRTRWIHEGTLRGDPVVAGSRCVFPRFNARSPPEPRCVASILEFHPNLQFSHLPRQVQVEDSSVPDPEGSNSISVLGVSLLEFGFESCFDDASKLATLPYTMAELKHESIAGERPIKGRPVIFMGEEHMVIIQRTHYGHTKGVTVLTF